MVYIWCILVYIDVRILELNWSCWNAILSNGLYMLYHTIYARWNFGTWNFWNANPSNGLFALYSLNLEYLNYWDVSLLNIPEIVIYVRI